MRWMCVFLLTAAVAFAQAPRGRRQKAPDATRYTFEVRDSETGGAVDGAWAEILNVNEGFANRTYVLRTGPDGSFTENAREGGRLKVKVEAPGYVVPLSERGREEAIYAALEGVKEQRVVLRLDRAADVEGVVMDRDTEQPVAGLRVRAHWARWDRERRRLKDAGVEGRTDAEGRFRMSGLATAEYFLEVLPASTERLTAGLRPLEEAVGYGRMYWPDGEALDAALPVMVKAGTRQRVGTIWVRKQALYGVEARIQSLYCRPGRQYEVVLYEDLGSWMQERGRTQTGCNGAVAAQGLRSGVWRMETELVTESGPVEGASVPVVIKKEGRKVRLAQAGYVRMDVRGHVRAGAAPERVKVQLYRVGRPEAAQPEAVEMEGLFGQLTAPGEGAMQLRVLELAPTLYVKEIVYNARRAEQGVFEMQAGAAEHRLEIVLGERPAHVSGVVKEGGKAAAGMLVVYDAWPKAVQRERPETKRVLADEQGRFALGALGPGEYRVCAMEARLAAKLEEPGVALRLLAGGETVWLEEGTEMKLELKPQQP